MKNLKLTAIILCVIFLFTACGRNHDTASYSEDTELGIGSKTLNFEITDSEKTVVFTIHTDAKTVGEALIEHNLISGENSQYGMYIKYANGVRADYNKDGAYWAFYKDGEYLNSGIEATEFEDGDNYELIYTKG